MPKLNDAVTRVDFRCPNEIVEEIEAIATARGNRINHKSGKVEISSVVLDLLKLGLEVYSPDRPVPDRVSDTRSDRVSDNAVTRDELEAAIGSLRTELQPVLDSHREFAELMGK